MAEVANDSVNPDISLLRAVNDLARQAPRGVDRAMVFVADYGVVALMAVLAGWCWWRVARRSADAGAAVAGVAWAVLAAGAALLLDLPVRALVQRPRPYAEHDGLDVLVRRSHDFSFVSGRAAFTAALAVGLFMVSRRLGVPALLLVLVEGFSQVYLGVHYPTDVIGGFALGAATALLLAPLALALLTAAATALDASPRWSWLVRSPAAPAPAGPGDRGGAPDHAPGHGPGHGPAHGPGHGPAAPAARHSAADKDLAA
jgi:undecaprenyl-diphosphatase